MGDKGTHPLEPGVITVRSTCRQEFENPLILSQNWHLALFSMYYTHNLGNAVLKSPTDYVGHVGTNLLSRSLQLSSHQQFTHAKPVLQELIQRLGLYVFQTLSGGTHHYG